MASIAAFRAAWSSVSSLIICDARSECQHLGALPGAQSADQRPGLALGLVEAAAGAHAEGVVDGQHGDFAGASARAERLRVM